jgi:hypothetical protein
VVFILPDVKIIKDIEILGKGIFFPAIGPTVVIGSEI